MKKKNNKKKWIALLVVIVVIAVGGAWWQSNRSRTSLAARSERFLIESSSISLVSLASGKITSGSITVQTSNTSVVQVDVQVGDIVEKDQQLGKTINNIGQQGPIIAEESGLITQIPSGVSNEFHIADPSILQVQIAIGEKDIHKISLDQQADVYIEALDVEFEGTVTNINKLGNTNQDYTTYPVTISFDHGDNDVFIGMSASAKIEISRKDNIAVVPFEAIITSNTNRYVLSAEWLDFPSQPQEDFYIPVTTGIADVYNVEVIGTDLIGQEILILPRSSSFPFFNQ